MIKVVDIFAGPGGLNEGFSQSRRFRIALSIEKDPHAWETLRLRSFIHQFASPPPEYYEFLRGEFSQDDLWRVYPDAGLEADRIAWQYELGGSSDSAEVVRRRVASRLGNDPWVLIGGPPCQAYSLIGRARNRGNAEYVPEQDVRQKLYVEYLQILADHCPPVFVMENVKGLLSASLNNVGLFRQILNDLRDPRAALQREGRPVRRVRGDATYKVYSLNTGDEITVDTPDACTVRSELYGVPQARHRVILLGVRSDVRRTPQALRRRATVSVGDVLAGMPRVRSGLSRNDSSSLWLAALRAQARSAWVTKEAGKKGGDSVARLIKRVVNESGVPRAGRGDEFIPTLKKPVRMIDWFIDKELEGVCNHTARGHMESDLWRYLYVAAFGQVHGNSPTLSEFPNKLLPDHASVARALSDGGNFGDRFRVQLAMRPSATIMSHISKDGHYYIHHDPFQVRSLTVREAARLQTFPDNYFFCGPRTEQYSQVGNAVPPFLAAQIAEIVADLFNTNG